MKRKLLLWMVRQLLKWVGPYYMYELAERPKKMSVVSPSKDPKKEIIKVYYFE